LGILVIRSAAYVKSLREPDRRYSFNWFILCLEVFIAFAVYQIFHSIFLAALAFFIAEQTIEFFIGLGEGIIEELRAIDSAP
jgi:hypothetical protein